MPFISISFAAFFAVTAALYHLAPRLGKNALAVQQALLLVASLAFYAAADVRFVPFLVYVVAVSYLAGRLAKSRLSFAIFVVADLLPLLFFKYSRAHWIFPLGLSFFTFQSLGYIMDVRAGKVASERNPLMVALFVGFFPTLASGPIQRAPVLLPQLKVLHRFDYDCASDGMRLFAWGMFKKLCIADRIAVYVDYVYRGAGERSGAALLLATVLYSFQIYCDFSGYSDMAIGAARFLGIDAGRNFDHPYLSQSVGEFWRRWHISLSSWLRDYVYIPLGGSRVPLPRIYLNLMVTFLVSGVWHGSSWNFVAWGLLHGTYLCAGRAANPFLKKLNVPAWGKIFVTFCLVTFAWIFFRAGGFWTAMSIVRKIMHLPKEILSFGDLRASLGFKDAVRTMLELKGNALGGLKGMARIGVLLFAFAAVSIITRKTSGLALIREKPIVVRFALYFMLIFAIYFLSMRGYSNNFIYQRF